MKLHYRWLGRTAVAGLGFMCMLAGVSGTALAGLGVPEIDPGSMVNALLVLSGGLLIVTGRRTRK